MSSKLGCRASILMETAVLRCCLGLYCAIPLQAIAVLLVLQICAWQFPA